MNVNKPEYREQCSERTNSVARWRAPSLPSRRTACLFPVAVALMRLRGLAALHVCEVEKESYVAPRPRRADPPSLRTAIHASIGRPAPHRGPDADGRPGILTLTSCMLRGSEGGKESVGTVESSSAVTYRQPADRPA